MIKHYLTLLLLAAIGFGPVSAQNDYFFPKNISFDPDIPTPQEFLGYSIGDMHTRIDRMVAYMEELGRVSDKADFQIIGYTNERRPQLVLTITSPDNHKNLDDIQQAQWALIDPEQSRPNTDDHPAIVLLGYNVHGNEPSSTEAAMLTAYYLLAAQNEETQTFLENAVVFVDPCFNPDGRDRHSHWANMHQAKNLSPDPLDREHNEVWPGGRTNHYWFDLNRDWLPLAQVESRNRLQFFHQWVPQVVTDYHEMGSNSTYFFEPTERFGSENPLVPRSNYDDLNNLFAEYFSEALHEIGSLYFTKEVYDNSYPGYGSTYPDIHGGLGLVFEQASSRGHVQTTSTEPITFPFTIRNHLRTSIATVRAAVENREMLFDHQRRFFSDALNDGKKSSTKAYVFGDSDDEGKTKAFISLLLQHQIKAYQLEDDITIDGQTYQAGQAYAVPSAQSQYRMVQTFFEPVTSFYDSVFYDASAWTIALAFNMPYDRATSNVSLGSRLAIEDLHRPIPDISEAKYAYLFEWSDYNAPMALNYLLTKGVNAKSAFEPFTFMVNGEEKTFGYGSVMIPVVDQHFPPYQIFQWVKEASKLARIPIYSVDGGMSTSGKDLGSRSFRTINQPKVAMLIGEGVSSYEAGEIWHLLDTRYGMSFSKIDVVDFNRVDLNKYNSLVLVSGNYRSIGQSGIDKIREWASSGGTLIVQRSAIPWAIRAKLVEEKLGSFPSPYPNGETPRYDYVTASERSGARRIGGSVYAADIDPTHPLGFGYSDRKINVYRNHTILLEPNKSPFSTVVQYTDDPLLDGYVHPENLKRLRNTVSTMVSPMGRGRAVLFVDNPNFRGFWFGTNRLLMNALFYGEHIGVPR
jgi:hypothetical protein